MHQAFYNHIGSRNPAAEMTVTAETAGRCAALVQWVARRWEMVGVLALMGSSATYGVFALTHLGL